MFKLSTSTLLAAAILVGCTSLAPDYARPDLPVADVWPILDEATGEEVSVQGLEWNDFITDDKLKKVIELALEENRDMQVALLNIERAQALFRVQNADRLPTLESSGSGSHQRAGGTTSHQYSATVGVSIFELDLFGKVASLEDKALEKYFESEQMMRTVKASLITEVASAYLGVAAEQERLKLAKSTLASHTESYNLIKRGHELGASPLLAVTQAQTLVESGKGDVARYTQNLERAKNALTLLVGSEVSKDLLPRSGSIPTVSASKIDAGVSSKVLLIRPDVMAAEHRLKAANADIGVARAALYPSITIGGGVGFGSSELSELFGSGSGVWSFIPKISLPIFDSGRNKTKVKVAETDQKIAQAEYEKTIQVAFKEVADVLAERGTISERIKAQEALIGANAKSVELSQARFNQGLDTHLSVLDAQRGLYASQVGLIELELTKSRNHLLLYKALGAGTT